MGRLRSRWVRGLVLWTVVLLAVVGLVAVRAMASLNDAQQACFFGFPSVPCPGADDPSVARLTFAFFGVPLVWLVGIGVAAFVWALKRPGDARPG